MDTSAQRITWNWLFAAAAWLRCVRTDEPVVMFLRKHALLFKGYSKGKVINELPFNVQQ